MSSGIWISLLELFDSERKNTAITDACHLKLLPEFPVLQCGVVFVRNAEIHCLPQPSLMSQSRNIFKSKFRPLYEELLEMLLLTPLERFLRLSAFHKSDDVGDKEIRMTLQKRSECVLPELREFNFRSRHQDELNVLRHAVRRKCHANGVENMAIRGKENTEIHEEVGVGKLPVPHLFPKLRHR